MSQDERRIIKNIPMPSWFEMEMVRMINLICGTLRIPNRIITLKNDGAAKLLLGMFEEIRDKKMALSNLITLKHTIRAMQDFLWVRFECTLGEDLGENVAFKADYDKQLIIAVEGKNHEKNKNIDKLKQLAKEITLEKLGSVKIQPTVPKTIKTNVSGEENIIENIEQFFRNQEKGNLNKK
jgi:hypothetical protein